MPPLGWIFVTALGATVFATLALLRVARRLGFYDVPNERSAHRYPAPLVGGLAFAVGTLLSLMLWAMESARVLSPVLVSLVFIAVLGCLDDWFRLSPERKLLGQVVVAVLLVGWAEVRLNHFEGVFGVGPLPQPMAVAVSLLGVVGIINAFNFMDGIDGLAGGLGLWVCAAFGIWMYGVNQVPYALFAAALAGGICAFLYFNVLSSARVFMGDAGSMFIGASAAVLALKFVEFNRELPDGHVWRMAAGPALAISVLFVPLFDEVRVFLVRLWHRRSPFRADRMHVHHQLLKRGFTHVRAAALLIGCCIGVTLMVWSLQALPINDLLLLEGALAFAASRWLR